MNKLNKKEGNALLIVVLVMMVLSIILTAAAAVAISNNKNIDKNVKFSQSLYYAELAVDWSSSYIVSEVEKMDEPTRASYKKDMSKFVDKYDSIINEELSKSNFFIQFTKNEVDINLKITLNDEGYPISTAKAVYGGEARSVAIGFPKMNEALGEPGTEFIIDDAILVDTRMDLLGATVNGSMSILNPTDKSITIDNAGFGGNHSIKIPENRGYKLNTLQKVIKFTSLEPSGIIPLAQKWFEGITWQTTPENLDEHITRPIGNKVSLTKEREMPSASIRKFPKANKMSPVILETQSWADPYKVVDESGNFNWSRYGGYEGVVNHEVIVPPVVYFPKFTVGEGVQKNKAITLKPSTGNTIDMVVDELYIEGSIEFPIGVTVNIYVNKPKAGKNNFILKPISLNGRTYNIDGKSVEHDNKDVSIILDTDKNYKAKATITQGGGAVKASIIGEFLDIDITQSGNLNIVAFGEDSRVVINRGTSYQSNMLFVPKGIVTFAAPSYRGSVVAKEVYVENSGGSIIWEKFDMSDLPVDITDPSGVGSGGSGGGTLGDPITNLLKDMPKVEVSR